MNRALCFVVLAALVLGGCAKPAADKTGAQGMGEYRRHLIEGNVYLKQGDPQKAVASFAKAIQADPSQPEAYLVLANVFLRLKQYQQTISVCASGIQRFPENGDLYYLLAVSQAEVGSLMGAVSAAKKSVDLFYEQNKEEEGKRAAAFFLSLVAKAREEGVATP
ncbi:MAG: tetratricopeptide repeat protein [Elusimicrobia bacterium]|nr:tetratricopeptide repeat protein [Elusimicrobiota bacterium]